MKTKLARLFLSVSLALALCVSFAPSAIAENADDGWGDDSQIYTAVGEDGQRLFAISGQISEGDEYISADNVLYRIASVDGTTAVAKRIGEETMPDVSWLSAGEAQAVFASLGSKSTDKNAKSSGDDSRKLIAMYVTHSDESYIPSDGTQSIEGQGGIYDVARAFRDDLQAKGIDVILDESTHLPHDASAYRRSRQTAERLLQNTPDAIIDIHRDGIPDESEYNYAADGEKASRVRLLVGRSNQNSEANREFAKQIKAVADEQYPGLIKDIFIGKGNYNQDLSPNAILLEFGTHTISKERAINSTELMAGVVSTALYGTQTSAASQGQSTSRAAGSGSMKGIGWLLLAIIIGVILFALAQTGGGTAMKRKIGRNMREVTGGLLGKKPNHDAM